MNPFKTDFLVSSGSFLTGAGSVMNIAGDYFKYNLSKTEEEADKRAIFSDWRMVGQDIEAAAARVRQGLLQN